MAEATTGGHLADMALRVVRRAHEEERGQALPLLIGAMFLFIVFGVLVLDFGMLFVDRREAQRAVDLAALAAAQELPGRENDPDVALKLVAAEDVASDYLAANGYTGGGGVDVAVTTNYEDDPAKIEVRAGREFRWLFGGLFGLVSQPIEARAVASANAQPRDVVLVLDRSGSMCQDSHGTLMLTCPKPPGHVDHDHNGVYDWQPFDTMRDAALEFATVLVPSAGGQALDRLSLVTYSTGGETPMQLGTSYGVSGSTFSNAIAAMRPDGYTNIGYGIARARMELASRGRPEALKVIVLLSDGYANRYRSGGSESNPRFTTCGNTVTCAAADNYARNEAHAAAQAGASIYSIGYTDRAGSDLLEDIAEIGADEGGGGEFFNVEDPEHLRDTFFEIASLTRVALIE